MGEGKKDKNEYIYRKIVDETGRKLLQLTAFVPNSAMLAVYMGYWGMGIITPQSTLWSMQANMIALMPSVTPLRRKISFGLLGGTELSRLVMKSAMCFLTTDIPWEFVYVPTESGRER